MADIKWSAFPNGGAMVTGDELVGLRSGANTRFTPVIPTQVQQSVFNFAAATGTNDAFVVNLSPAVTSLTDGLLVSMNSGSLSNLTTTPTLKINALAPVAITTFAGSAAPGDIQTNSSYIFIYDASNNKFELINPSTTTADTFQVQSNGYSYALDSGVVNAYVANILPEQLVTQSGLQIVMTPINTNTGASTLTVNGATHPIVLSNGDALSGGEILINKIYIFIYSSALTSYVLINSAKNTQDAATSITATGGTTILTALSTNTQIINGSTFQVIQMPDTSTLNIGRQFKIINNSTSTTSGFSINDSTGTLMKDCLPGVQYLCTCTSTSDTTFTGWSIAANIFSIKKLGDYGNFQYTGSTPADVFNLYYTQAVVLQNIAFPINGKYYNNLLNVSIQISTPITTTSVNAGNAQVTGTFPFNAGAGLTSLIGNELLTNTNLNLQASTLTTVTLPKYIYNSGNINLGNCTFTTLSLGELIIANIITFNTTTLVSFSIPKCQSIQSNITFTSATALTTFSAPLCQVIAGTISGTATVLTTFTFTVLKYIFVNFTLTAAALTSLSLPALVNMYGTWGTTMALCTSVDLSLLQNVVGAVTASFAALTTLSFPAIVSFGAAVTFTAANLVTFSMGATLKSVGGNWTMTGMKLDQASVDGILVSLAALDGTGGTTAYSSKTVNLSGGTSATPSATGLAAKAVLVARGCTVTNN
jgi:hypothetical protein